MSAPPPTSTPPPSAPCWPHRVAVGLCLALGFAFRFYGAWANRCITDPDAGTVALMAKHMAAGRDFPVFFYGQAYMGSLEPAVSALLCRLFGTSGFMVCLGTALLGALALPVLYAWARDAAGRTAALAALALCVLGPYAYFLFQFNPRGGYMLTILLSLLVLWLGARLADALWRRAPVAWWHFARLGLLAGLGWWTNPLIFASLVTAALVLLIGARGRPPLRGVISGLLAFGVGSLPFWIWNLRHGGESFTMVARVGALSWLQGCGLLGEHYLRLLGLPDGATPGRAAALALPLLLIGGGAAGAAWRCFRPRAQFQAHRVALLVFLLLSAALLVTSSYARMNTARYLLTWVAPAAVLAGLAVAALHRRWGLIPAALPVVFVMATQAPVLRELRATNADVPGRQAYAAEVEAFAHAHAIEAYYAAFLHHALNFAMGECVPVSGLTFSHYLPIARAAEAADRIAMFGNPGGTPEFLKVGGGAAASEILHRRMIEYDFHPPAGGLVPLAPADWAAVRAAEGGDPRAVLTDRNLDTAWRVCPKTPRDEWLEVTFAAPTVLRAARLRAPNAADYPRAMRVDILPADGGSWQTLLADHTVPAFYWSGPRIFYSGTRYRQEYRFADPAVRGIRFVALAGERPVPEAWSLCELELFGPGPDEPAELEALPALLAHLDQTGIRRLYSDRWLANRVHAARGGAIEVMLEPTFYPDTELRVENRLRLDPGTAVIVRRADAEATRAVLQRQGAQLAETALPPWVLFAVPGEKPACGPGGTRLPLCWTGYAVLTAREDDYARDVLQAARAAHARDADPAAILDMLTAAVAADPLPLLDGADLLASLAQELPPERQADLRALTPRVPAPAREVGARFAQKIELIGVSVEPTRVRPGTTAAITYYWRLAPGAEPTSWAVFVHFRQQGDIRFQDDHRLAGVRAAERGAPRTCAFVVREEETVRVPANAPAGPYDLHLGLYRGPKQRAAVTGYAPVKHRAVIVPALLEVAPEAARVGAVPSLAPAPPAE